MSGSTWIMLLSVASWQPIWSVLHAFGVASINALQQRKVTFDVICHQKEDPFYVQDKPHLESQQPGQEALAAKTIHKTGQINSLLADSCTWGSCLILILLPFQFSSSYPAIVHSVPPLLSSSPAPLPLKHASVTAHILTMSTLFGLKAKPYQLNPSLPRSTLCDTLSAPFPRHLIDDRLFKCFLPC